MNFFTKTKLLLATIVILSTIIIAILGTIGFHYFRNSNRVHEKPMVNQQPGMFMAKQLKLSPDQIKEFDSLRDKFHENLNTLESDIKSTSKNIMEEIISENTNRDKLDSLAKRFGDLQTQQKTITISHLLEVKGKLDQEQRTNFSKFLKRMEKRDIERFENQKNRTKDRPREKKELKKNSKN